MKRVASTGALVALLAVSCAGGTGVLDDARATSGADAPAGPVRGLEMASTGALGEQERRCVDAALVARLGAERAGALGDVEGTDAPARTLLRRDEAEAAADAVLGCVDLGEQLVEAIVAGRDVSDDSLRCLADRVSPDDLRAALVERFMGAEVTVPEQVTAAVLAGFGECLTPDELERVSR